mgnify:CR=1 FL=1
MFENVYKILNNAATLNEDEAFRLEFGIDSDSDSLGEYAAFTVNARSSLGLQTGHVDFKVTGDYWNSWTVNLVGDVIEINVNNERFNELVNELSFSDTHVGLTEENINILAEKMLVNYREYIINKMLN